jgi:integrase
VAHIQVRKTRKGKSYRVRYVDPDGRERSRSFPRRALAEDFQTEVAHALRASSYIDPSAGRQTVQEYLEEWRTVQTHHRPKTADGTRIRFKTMVYPYIGAIPIGKLKPSNIRSWQKTLVDAGYAASSIKGARGQVAGAFNHAVLDRRLPSSPFKGVKAPEVLPRKVVPRTVEQVRAGQAAMPEQYRAIIPTVAGSGMRPSEAWGLTVDRVDFLRREIRIDRQLTGRNRREPIFGPPKTKASDRTIPVGDTVIAALADHLRRHPAQPHELIFRTSRGTPLTRTVWGRAWRPAAEAMGLTPGEGLHQLRHFYASLLIADGRPVTEVQERLGHASAQETLDTYSHLWPGSEDGTRNAIDAAFATTKDGDPQGGSRRQGRADV